MIDDNRYQQQKKMNKQSSRWLLLLSRSSRRYLNLSILIAWLSSALLIVQLFIIAHVIDRVYMHQASAQALLIFFAGLLLLIIFRAMLNGCKQLVSFRAAASIQIDLRQKMLQHIYRLGPVTIRQFSTAHLSQLVIDQVDAIHEFFVDYLPQMRLALLIPLTILMIVFLISKVCAVILLICAPLIPFFMILVGMGAESLQQKHFQALSRMSSYFLDSIQGLVTLKLLGKSKAQLKKIAQVSNDYRLKTMRVLKLAFLSSAVLEVFSAASIALLAIYLGMGFINNGTNNSLWWHLHHIGLQSALFILLLAPEFFLPLRRLATHYHARAKAIAAANEILTLLNCDAEQQHKQPEMIKHWPPSQIALQFRAASVCYTQTDVLALDKLDLSIKCGDKVAMIGRSGAGKTTLLNTLLKFILPTAGDIYCNGIDLKVIPSSQWHQVISYLSQQSALFRASISDNLRLANQQADDQQLVQALKQAHLWQWVSSLPDGMDTMISERGDNLSGGQAQRLALARIFLRQSPLLLLDEPTASLDAEHEQQLISEICQFWQHQTVLLSTHRLAWLQQVDHILVLDKGKIVQQGSLQQLLDESSGLFAQLYQEGVLL